MTATSSKGTSAPSVPSAAFASQTVPRAPTLVAATGQNGGASVAFTPGVDGGSPVTNFYASCTSSDGGTSFGIFTGASSPIVVQNLTNGKTYTCTVYGTNAVGQGPASAPSNSFVVSAVPGVPGPPTIGTAVIAAQSATVAFTAGNPGDSPILSFTITCTSTNGGVAASATDVTSPIFVFGLTNGRTYSCSAIETNAIGPSLPSSHTTAFLVGDLPGPPRAPSAQPGNGNATVSWTAPASNGGAPITGYIVTPFIGFAAQPARTFNKPGVKEVISGLTNGRTYTFVVVAKNGIGAGPASGPSAGVLIGTPAAPRSVVASPGLSSASVAWAPPTTPGAGPITGYQVIPYANGLAKPAVTVKSVARSVMIGHLAIGVTYVFRIAALEPLRARADVVAVARDPGGHSDRARRCARAARTVGFVARQLQRVEPERFADHQVHRRVHVDQRRQHPDPQRGGHRGQVQDAEPEEDLHLYRHGYQRARHQPEVKAVERDPDCLITHGFSGGSPRSARDLLRGRGRRLIVTSQLTPIRRDARRVLVVYLAQVAAESSIRLDEGAHVGGSCRSGPLHSQHRRPEVRRSLRDPR